MSIGERTLAAADSLASMFDCLVYDCVSRGATIEKVVYFLPCQSRNQCWNLHFFASEVHADRNLG